MQRPFVLVKSSHAHTLAMMQHITYEFLGSAWTTFTANKPHNKWLLLYGMDDKRSCATITGKCREVFSTVDTTERGFSTVATTERDFLYSNYKWERFLHSSYNWHRFSPQSLQMREASPQQLQLREVFSTVATNERGFLHSSYNWDFLRSSYNWERFSPQKLQLRVAKRIFYLKRRKLNYT